MVNFVFVSYSKVSHIYINYLLSLCSFCISYILCFKTHDMLIKDVFTLEL